MTSVPGSPWLAERVPPGARYRLLCFPHAGGGALLYRPWVEWAPPGLAVLPVHLPGREERYREAPFRDLDSLVEALLGALEPVLGQPYGLFGHSMGAIVAFELARRLVASNAAPDHLFVSACRAPHLHDGWPGPIGSGPGGLTRELLRLGGTPAEALADARVIELLEPVIRADIAMCHGYRATIGPPLRCPIAAFGGADDDATPEALLRAWQAHTSGPFWLRVFPGGHFYLRQHQAALLRAIVGDLAGHLPGSDRFGGLP